MVKAINLVIGFALFSIVVSMFFFAISETMKKNNVGNDADRKVFRDLSGQYADSSSEQSGDGSTARQIIDGTKVGDAGSEDTSNYLVTGALSGGRLSVNFLSYFENIINNAKKDASKGGQNYIDEKIVSAAIAILVLILAFIAIHFLRGFKTET